MNFNTYTIKAQETVQRAVQLTRAAGNQALEPVHLLKAILTEGDAVIKFLLEKLDINSNIIEREVERELATLPRVQGAEPYLSNDSNKVLDRASELAQKAGDSYVTVEILFKAIFSVKSPASRILKDAGITADDLQAAIDELRKGKRLQHRKPRNNTTRSRNTPSTSTSGHDKANSTR